MKIETPSVYKTVEEIDDLSSTNIVTLFCFFLRVSVIDKWIQYGEKFVYETIVGPVLEFFTVWNLSFDVSSETNESFKSHAVEKFGTINFGRKHLLLSSVVS